MLHFSGWAIAETLSTRVSFYDGEFWNALSHPLVVDLWRAIDIEGFWAKKRTLSVSSLPFIANGNILLCAPVIRHVTSSNQELQFREDKVGDLPLFPSQELWGKGLVSQMCMVDSRYSSLTLRMLRRRRKIVAFFKLLLAIYLDDDAKFYSLEL